MKQSHLLSALCYTFLSIVVSPESLFGQEDRLIVQDTYSVDAFPLVHKNLAANIYVDGNDFEVVRIASEDLRNDIGKVSGVLPEVMNRPGASNYQVIVGSLDRCELLAKLSDQKKIDIEDLKGQWETFKILLVENPFPGVEKALVIVGSDRRGTAYGIYELSKQIGVSPWHFWADVPVKKKANIYIKVKNYQLGPPSVKFRGIFINDSGYGLKPWAAQTQDPGTNGMGVNTYRHVFELLLRLKANYTWNAGDAERAKLADQYAIVLGTPHNEQMLSSDWDSGKQGPWQYDVNRVNIYNHWNEQVEKLGGFDAVYTLGMRGSGDLPMVGELNIDEKVALMEKIMDDQQEILTRNINKPLEDIPQALVLYKEVLGLYNQGIEVPENVTLVWPDDNYGYIKRLSNSKERARSGGAGVYYHLSYLGRPHDYLWLSSTNPALIWSEMKKAYDFNARELWVFNVGDIKPAEYNLSFSMDLAWDLTKFDKDNIWDHQEKWMGDIFGHDLAGELGEIKYQYYQLAFERKPEFMGWDRLEPTTPVVDTKFSSINYREAERRLSSSKELKEKTEAIFQEIPKNHRASYFQLLWYPVACLYYTDAKLLYAQTNRLYASQGRASTNHYAELAAQYWDSIKIATTNYHKLLDGKWVDIIQWDGIGINRPTYWLPETSADTLLIENQPNYFMPPVEKNSPEEKASMGIFVEGFNNHVLIDGNYSLPWYNMLYKNTYFFDIFNKGRKSFEYHISTSDDWIMLSENKGICHGDSRISVSVDYRKLAEKRESRHKGVITVKGAGSRQKIDVFAFTPLDVSPEELSGLFVEDNGVISIDAENYHRKTGMIGFGWEKIKGLGQTGNCIGAFPFTAKPVEQEWTLEHNKAGAYVEYDFYCFNRGWIDIYSYCLPTFPINSQRHCLYGISIDDGPPLIVDFETHFRCEEWKQNVQSNQAENRTQHFIQQLGKHTLKIWMIDTGVFMDKLVIDLGGLKDSYMGPMQTRINWSDARKEIK